MVEIIKILECVLLLMQEIRKLHQVITGKPDSDLDNKMFAALDALDEYNSSLKKEIGR